jgi:phosphoserine phosphatase
MKTLEMNNPIYFDIDDTLVREITKLENAHGTGIKFVPHPLRGNRPVPKYPMRRNIDLLRDMHARGRTIVVWSAAGWQWAEAVIKALALESYVHYVIEKPIAYVDDLLVQNL